MLNETAQILMNILNQNLAHLLYRKIKVKYSRLIINFFFLVFCLSILMRSSNFIRIITATGIHASVDVKRRFGESS